MKTLKYSRQRESIKACLMSRKDHPTADALYTSIREQFPNISLGTVYRNLNLLVELGEIRKLSCGDGTDHFDYDTSPHDHYVCRQCGRVMDIPMEATKELETAADHDDQRRSTLPSPIHPQRCSPPIETRSRIGW